MIGGITNPQRTVRTDGYAVCSVEHAIFTEGPYEFAIAREHTKIGCDAHKHDDIAFAISRYPRGGSVPDSGIGQLRPLCINFEFRLLCEHLC